MRRTIKSLISSQQRPDTPTEREQRFALNALFEQVRGEIRARWPEITAENASAALDWQEARISELRRERGL